MNRTLRSLSCALALALPGAALAQTETPSLEKLPAASVAAPAPSQQAELYEVGRRYLLESKEGVNYVGVVVSLGPTALQLDTKERGIVTIGRDQIRRVEPLVSDQTGAKVYIGNGHRLFFEPTARGLRKGENFLQITTIYYFGAFVGGDIGITKNISLGGSALLSPLWGTQSSIKLAPKVSFPVSEKVHVGIVAQYQRTVNFGRGEGWFDGSSLHGLVTYGSADNNVTGGVGLRFFGAKLWSTPFLKFGVQTRVLRGISLFSENSLTPRVGTIGLYGIKLNLNRVRIGLAAQYTYATGYEETNTYNPPSGPSVISTTQYPSRWNTSALMPVYFDFTFRFGKAVEK